MSTLIGSAIQNMRGSISPRGTVWALSAGVLTFIGLAAVINYLIHGHDAYGTTREVAWGMHVGAYEFFVSISAGLAIIASVGVAFRLWGLEKIAKKALVVAFFSLLAGFFVLFTEIGYPLRMLIYTVLSPNPQAALFWMGVMFGLYLMFLLVQIMFLLFGKMEKARFWALSTLVMAILVLGNVGTVFGYLSARPFWHGPFLPPYIILTSVIAGLGLIFLLIYLQSQQKNQSDNLQSASEKAAYLFVILLFVLAFFELSKILVGVYGQYPGKYEATKVLLTGPLAFNFWMFEIIIGITVPIVLVMMTKGKSLLMNMLAGVSAVVGMFFMRYDMVIAGQLKPMRYDSEVVGASGLLSYAPTMTEVGIVLGGIGLCLLMYIAANMVFNLDADEHY